MNKHFVQGQIPVYIIVIEIILTLILAECSYRYVEVPIRVQGFKYFLPKKSALKPLIIRSCFALILVSCSTVILLGHYDALQHDDKKEVKTTFTVTDNEPPHKSLILPVPKIIINNPQSAHQNVDYKDAPLFIGDSVMVDIGEELHKNYPNSLIDGKVGRHLYDAIPLVQDKYPYFKQQNQQVVLELGTNGDFSYEDLTKLINLFGNAKVYVVNTHVPRDWEESVNEKLAKAADAHKNVQLIDWYSTSQSHSDYFAYDGVHLEHQGVQALVSEINKHMKH